MSKVQLLCEGLEVFDTEHERTNSPMKTKEDNTQVKAVETFEALLDYKITELQALTTVANVSSIISKCKLNAQPEIHPDKPG